MRFFRSLSAVLTVTGIGLFLFDLVYGWIADAKLKIRSVEQLGTDISKSGYEQVKITAESILPLDKWESFVQLPATAVILGLALFFYLIFRILFQISGESRGGRL